MKKIRLILTVLAVMISNLAFAQNLTVTGKVKDSSTGEPVPFAGIQLKGTMTGGMTDGDGRNRFKARFEHLFESVLNSPVVNKCGYIENE